MSKITLRKLNESFIKVESNDNGLLYELSDYYSYMASGAKFDYRFKNHLWDGKVRLLSARTGKTLLGLRESLHKFCADRYVECEDLIDENLNPYHNDSTENLDEFIQSLNLPFPPRDYQYDALKHAISSKRSIILSPTGSGKSLLLYMWVRWHLKKGRKIALIVPNIGLLKQMENDFREYSAKDTSWKIDEEITLLGGKHKANAFDVDKCLLTTWQSLIKYDKETMATFDVVTVDECHASKASSIKSILETSVNAPFRLGVTGSLDGELINTMLITGLFGEVKQYVSTVELQSKGSLSDLAIHSITLEYPKEDRIELNALLKTKEYMKEIDFLNEHKVRNTFITNLACKSKGTVLVLFRYTKHGRLIHQMIGDTLKKMGIDRPLHYIDGSVDNREEIRTNINEGENAILVASVQTTATGLNIPSIEHIIYACPFKGRILGLQSVGRGLRLSEGKTYCNLYDICDDLQYRRKRNYSLKWSADRLLIFIEQGFKINYKKLTLPNRKE